MVMHSPLAWRPRLENSSGRQPPTSPHSDHITSHVRWSFCCCFPHTLNIMSQRRVCDACAIRRVRCDGRFPCAGCMNARSIVHESDSVTSLDLKESRNEHSKGWHAFNGTMRFHKTLDLMPCDHQVLHLSAGYSNSPATASMMATQYTHLHQATHGHLI
jgi:hypothetical protein